MPEFVAEWYEPSHVFFSYRVYTAEGVAVEPVTSYPLQLWAAADDERREAIRSAAIAFSMLHYPQYTEEVPSSGTDTKRRRDKATDGAPIDSDDVADTDQPPKGSKPARERG